MNDHNSDKFDLPPSSGDELSGKVLSGRYEILRRIDSGGKGAIYQAKDLELDTAVAIRILPTVLADDKRSIDNLLRKSKAILKLSHPNIVRLHAFQSDGTTKYLVMEYVDGRNLEDKVFDEGTMDISGALKIFAQVAAGLDYAHSQNVLHGDIKPANIMLAKDGKAKLADFGSRCLKEAMSRATGGKTSQTLFYMAPEQFGSGEPDRSSDIYSLAASMYECLCGHPPFWGDSIEQQILNEEPETIEKLSDKQNAALLKALSKNPRDRQKNAKQLLTDLGADYPKLKRETKPSKKFKDTSDRAESIVSEEEKPEDKSKNAAVIAILSVLLALMTGIGILGWLSYKKHQRELALATNLWKQAQSSAKQLNYEEAIAKAKVFINKYPDSHYAKEAKIQLPLWEQVVLQDKIAELLSKATNSKNKGEFDRALECIFLVFELDPKNSEAKTLQIEVKSLKEAKRIAAEKEKQFEELKQEALSFEAKNDWEEAIKAYNDVLVLKPDDIKVKEKLITCQHLLYLTKAEEAESKGDLDSAVDSYTKALSYKRVFLTEARLDSAKKKLQAKREAEHRKTEYDKWISQAQNSEKQGNYSEAIKFYEKAQQYTDISLQTTIDSLKMQVAKVVLRSQLAGRWYPADTETLSKQIEGFFQKAGVKPINNVIAFILPHAGYQFSGQTAALALKTTDKKYKRIVIIGPSHRVAMEEVLSVPRVTHYETPLGQIPLDVKFIEKLLEYSMFQSVPQAHKYEHSVHIELPLLQYTQKDFKLVPIVASTCSLETISKAGTILKSLVDEETLVIASSDFVHYGSRFSYVPFAKNVPEQIKKIDMGAYEHIAGLDSKGFLEYKRRTGATICGYISIAILLSMLDKPIEAELINYTTSGQLTGDFTNSVSYLSIAFSGMWANYPQVKPKPADEVAVIVNGVDILESDVEAQIKSQLEKMAAQLPPAFVEQYKKQLRQQVLEKMIVERLLDEKVKAAKIAATEEEVIDQLEKMASAQKPPLSLEDFKALVKAYGRSFDEVKQQIQKGLGYQKLMEAQWAGRINVTEDDAKKYYYDNKSEFEVPEQVRASHILINTKGISLAQAKAKAEDLHRKLIAGANFVELAKAYSVCPSASKGGDLGFFERGRMVREFEKVAFGLKIGQISDVVKTNFGYHIIKVTDRKGIKVISFEEAKDNIIKALIQKKQNELAAKYIEFLKSQAEIIYLVEEDNIN